jgi:hypothetical protein
MIAGTKGCSGWAGTMTGTYTWHLADTHGSGASTFTGLWEATPGGQAIVPCQAESNPNPCVAYFPHGTINWTWDVHRAGCSVTRAGDFPAGAVNDPRNAPGGTGIPLSTQILVLQPDGAGHYGYWGNASWSLPQPLACDDGFSGTAHPPSYFDLSASSSGSGAADPGGNTCGHTTWQIDTKADTIAGSCFEWNNTGQSFQLEWNLKRVGSAPGS